MKTCTGCNKTKDETEFYGHDKPGHGHAKCKACVKASRKTPEAVAKRRKERSKPEFVARGARGRGYYTEAQQAEIVSCQRTAKLLYAERKPQREALCA